MEISKVTSEFDLTLMGKSEKVLENAKNISQLNNQLEVLIKLADTELTERYIANLSEAYLANLRR